MRIQIRLAVCHLNRGRRHIKTNTGGVAARSWVVHRNPMTMFILGRFQISRYKVRIIVSQKEQNKRLARKWRARIRRSRLARKSKLWSSRWSHTCHVSSNQGRKKQIVRRGRWAWNRRSILITPIQKSHHSSEKTFRRIRHSMSEMLPITPPPSNTARLPQTKWLRKAFSKIETFIFCIFVPENKSWKTMMMIFAGFCFTLWYDAILKRLDLKPILDLRLTKMVKLNNQFTRSYRYPSAWTKLVNIVLGFAILQSSPLYINHLI